MHEGKGGLIRGATQVLTKRSAYLQGAYTRGVYWRRNTVCLFPNLFPEQGQKNFPR